MRAKTINEVQKFERGKDPKTSMDIGMTPERRLEYLEKRLEDLDISMRWSEDTNMGDGFYYIIVDDDGKLSDLNLQIGYSTDEASMAEHDEPGGFWMADENGEFIIDPDEASHDPEILIKHLLKIKYDGIKDINEEIEKLKKRLDNLNKVKVFLENEG